MFHFVPAWYSRTIKWVENELPWQETGFLSDFDDCISQAQIFLEAGENVNLIILGYSPNLRSFLYKKGISRATYWSFFDEMQDIHLKEPRMFSWKNFLWPEKLRWMYTPVEIQGYLEDKLYCRLSFSESGNLMNIEQYGEDNKRFKLYFDDRGLLSSIIEFDNDQYQQHTFYDPQGNWRFNQQKDGSIIINPDFSFIAKKPRYDTIDELMKEKLDAYLTRLTDQDVLVTTADLEHNHLFKNKQVASKKVMSFFRDRFPITPETDFGNDIDLYVTDTQLNKEKLNPSFNAIDISPFDVRFEFGKSQRINELIIYLPIEHTPLEEFKDAVEEIFTFMDDHETVQLVVAQTPDNPVDKFVHIRQLEDMAKEHTFNVDNEQKVEWDPMMDEEEPEPPRVRVQLIQGEDDVFDIMEFARLIVDVRQEPDIYTQIAGISAGIPQVNLVESQYVEHKKNGYIIGSIDNMSSALEYFLVGLAHWNEALVYSFQKRQRSTGEYLIQQWKEALYGKETID